MNTAQRSESGERQLIPEDLSLTGIVKIIDVDCFDLGDSYAEKDQLALSHYYNIAAGRDSTGYFFARDRPSFQASDGI